MALVAAGAAFREKRDRPDIGIGECRGCHNGTVVTLTSAGRRAQPAAIVFPFDAVAAVSGSL